MISTYVVAMTVANIFSPYLSHKQWFSRLSVLNLGSGVYACSSPLGLDWRFMHLCVGDSNSHLLPINCVVVLQATSRYDRRSTHGDRGDPPRFCGGDEVRAYFCPPGGPCSFSVATVPSSRCCEALTSFIQEMVQL